VITTTLRKPFDNTCQAVRVMPLQLTERPAATNCGLTGLDLQQIELTTCLRLPSKLKRLGWLSSLGCGNEKLEVCLQAVSSIPSLD
jgi:hypothetical protein